MLGREYKGEVKQLNCGSCPQLGALSRDAARARGRGKRKGNGDGLSGLIENTAVNSILLCAGAQAHRIPGVLLGGCTYVSFPFTTQGHVRRAGGPYSTVTEGVWRVTVAAYDFDLAPWLRETAPSAAVAPFLQRGFAS